MPSIRLPWQVLGVAAAILVLVGCRQTPDATTQEQRLPANESLADRLILASAKVALPPAGVSAADLPNPHSRGAELVARYCTACHQLVNPSLHSVIDWPGVVRRMWFRMDRVDSTFNVPAPNIAERIVMLEYLVNNALRVSAADLPAGRGRGTFSETCSRCHALPDVRQHSPEDWVAVVRRMTGRMEQMLGEVPSREDVAQIIRYLEQVSS